VNKQKRMALALVAGAALTGCAGPGARAPLAQVPAKLSAGAGESLLMVVPARGVQIYECRPKPGAAATHEWAFVAPEAALFDERGAAIGRHYAGPNWEALDGSKVSGRVRERADAPVAGAIPWLLLSASSAGPAGRFSKVTSIQRVNTSGGAAPNGGCSAQTTGQQARVDYGADYYFFAR
jgi:hypothetical protein